MPRELTADEKTVVTGRSINIALFAVLDWPSGITRVWSGVGPFIWGGETFSGVGDFGGVSPIVESSTGKANGIMLTLAGVPVETVSAVLSENYQQRTARVYLGFLQNDGRTLIQDPPREIFGGKMNVASDTDDGTSATVSISIEPRMIIAQQASNRRYTFEDQKLEYPSDLGMEYIAAVNKQSVDNWGVPGPAILSRAYGQSKTS